MAIPLVILMLTAAAARASALEPASLEAARIALLTWWMFGCALVIWLAVLALTWACVRANPEHFTRRRAWLIIAGGGAILPAAVLAMLLSVGLAMLPALIAPAPPGSLTVAVDGELWWWRVRYGAVATANEIHLPVGEPVELQLASDNVIHAFWVPALGGKMDMIPGRATRMAITPTRTGVYPGACAEFCGTSHARMRFEVVVEEKAAFQRWLAHQATPATPPSRPLAARGQTAFLANGCGGCHAVRGTAATGLIGPDLTHVASRRQIAAGTRARTPATLARWIETPEVMKPGTHMPRYAMLPAAEREALVAYLESLE